MHQLHIVHHDDTKAAKKISHLRIVEIFVRSTNDGGFAKDRGLGHNDIVYVPDGNYQGRVESDQICNVAEKGDVLINAVLC